MSKYPRPGRLLPQLALLISVFIAGLLTATPALAVLSQSAAPTGFWTTSLHILQSAQRDFDAEITLLMDNFRHNNNAAWWLIGLSFVYGLLHAAGPGHGKAVISSYLIANNETLKRGILLAFLSSLLQAITAIILVGLVFLIFTEKRAQQAATHDLEIIGAALIMLLGLRLLWRKTCSFRKHKTIKHNHKSGEECGCGHHHIAAPKNLKAMNWKQALPLIFSVGIRPCTGALVAMSFALMNGLFVLGAVAVLAMSLGTFLIVSGLAYIAVNAKKLALKLSQDNSKKMQLQNGLEWTAALFIFLSGCLLLFASIY